MVNDLDDQDGILARPSRVVTPMSVGMASWMRPDACEVPLPVRVEVWAVCIDVHNAKVIQAKAQRLTDEEQQMEERRIQKLAEEQREINEDSNAYWDKYAREHADPTQEFVSEEDYQPMDEEDYWNDKYYACEEDGEETGDDVMSEDEEIIDIQYAGHLIRCAKCQLNMKELAFKFGVLSHASSTGRSLRDK